MTRKGLRMLLVGAFSVGGLTDLAEGATATIEFATAVLRRGESSSYVLKATTEGAMDTGLVAALALVGQATPPFINITGHTIYSDCGDNCGNYISPSILAGEQVLPPFSAAANNSANILMVVSAGNFGLPTPSGNIARFDFDVPVDAPLGPQTNDIVKGIMTVYDGNFGYNDQVIPPENYMHGIVTILPQLADANGDTLVDENDVAVFVQALIDPAAYTLATGLEPTDACDMNGDGNADGKDIQAFVDRIINGP